MSNQQGPVNRPSWFRLATMMRPPPPPPTTPAPPPSQPPEPLPPTRPAFIRPTFRAQPPPPPPPQQPTSPPPPPPPVASPPPPPPPVASPPPPSPPVASPPPPSSPVASPPPPSPAINASTPTVVPPPPPTPPSPTPTVMLTGPTMPSPRIIGTTPPSPTAAAAGSPSSSAPQLPATYSSTIPSSPITNRPFPSFLSPKPKLSIPSPSPSPSQAGLTTTTAHLTSPTSSPKTVKTLGKTPPPSPNLKPLSHPPSPLTLPPPQLNPDTEQKSRSPPVYEQKTVLVHDTNQKPKASPKNFNTFKPTINTNSPKHDIPKKNMNHKKHIDTEDSGTVIITISGENKGAIMELIPSKKPTERGHFNAQKSGSNNSSDAAKNKDQKAIPQPMSAFTNSNVQCVNNSILYNCSMTHHDPGVHFSIYKKPNGHNGIHLKD